MSTPAPTTAVITLAHGRHPHLANQRRSLAASAVAPALHVVVAMDDPEIEEVVAAHPVPGTTTRVVHCERAEGNLPLSAARNLGASTATGAGAEVLVFLDVDCIAEPELVGTYAATVGTPSGTHATPRLWCGVTGRLREVADPIRDYPVEDLAALRALSDPAAGRPTPGPGEVVEEPELTRFWSLNFAMGAADFEAVGGFDEAYVGYGGEDTDFAQRVGAAGGTMAWLGGAAAHHQWHTTHSPPWDHVQDVVRNAGVFAERWGWWPMEGWLAQFAEAGLVRRDADTGAWELVARP
ncbi:glycosyltransferase family 2 protein [Kytococcus sedentarius]|uniref:glycosyltransferase family 2 protein n=1 Tax=Kytococcus sedentarius TaxID=1276 RepID=UPI0035BC577A